jgi:hypothetical protein
MFYIPPRGGSFEEGFAPGGEGPDPGLFVFRRVREHQGEAAVQEKGNVHQRIFLLPSGEEKLFFPGRKIPDLPVQFQFNLFEKRKHPLGEEAHLRMQGFPKTLLQEAFFLFERGKGKKSQHHTGKKHEENVEKREPRCFEGGRILFSSKPFREFHGDPPFSRIRGFFRWDFFMNISIQGKGKKGYGKGYKSVLQIFSYGGQIEKIFEINSEKTKESTPPRFLQARHDKISWRSLRRGGFMKDRDFLERFSRRKKGIFHNLYS